MTTRKQNRSFTGKITTPETPWLATEETKPTSVKESTIKIEQIKLPSNQPRRYFEETALSDLAASIKQHGILQPLLVRPLTEGDYELVAGERRYRAAQQVGLTEVPVTIKTLTLDEAWQLALIENLQREDLNPIEETEGILQLLSLKLQIPVKDVSPLLHRLQKEHGGALNQDKENSSNNVIGKQEDEKIDIDNQVIQNEQQVENNNLTHSSNNVIGKLENEPPDVDNQVISEEKQADNNVFWTSEIAIIIAVFTGLGLMTWESFITNRLPLLNLPSDVIELLRQGKIAYTKAREIAKVKDETIREQILTEAIDLQLSLNQIKERIQALNPKTSKLDPDITERFKGAMVKIKKQKILEDPKKRKLLENLLSKIEALIESEAESQIKSDE